LSAEKRKKARNHWYWLNNTNQQRQLNFAPAAVQSFALPEKRAFYSTVFEIMHL